MSGLSRREFLQAALVALCPDGLAGGRYLGTVPFEGADRYPPFHMLTASGLDARLYTDLSALTSDTLVTPTDRFFVRTSAPVEIETRAGLAISVTGLVKYPCSLSLHALEADARPAGPFLAECAGNSSRAAFGLMSAATWSGVPVSEILGKAQPLSHATLVRISGFDRHSQPSNSSIPGASWIFPLDRLVSSGAMLATGMNGRPLTRDHGWPVRLVVPGWYGCSWIKWVDDIALVDDSAPATPQMQEFAARTHQDGMPALARDYRPAVMDLAALPIRIEKWILHGKLRYRVVGILWGGARPQTRLQIRFAASEPLRLLDVCPAPSTTLTWSLWSYQWHPPQRGRYDIVVKAADPAIPSRRLDSFFYARRVWIDEV